MLHKKILIHLKKILGSDYNVNIFKNILEQEISSSSLKAITLLAHRWSSPGSKTINPATEVELGIITLLGWIGYTIFDHSIDGQHDIIKSIPLAEKCVRELHWRLAKLCSNDREKLIATELLSLIENAHRVECNGKVPQPWQKSAGHMIGPLLITLKQGDNLKSAKYIASKKYFVQFLTIKQLSDDLRDWEDDWKAGRHTIVTEHIRQQVVKEEKLGKKSNLNSVRKIFALTTLKHFCPVLIRRGNIALKLFKSTGEHRDPEHFRQVIIRLQSGAKNALNYINSVQEK